MNWSEPRKANKSTEFQANQRVSTTCLNTPPRNSHANHDEPHLVYHQSIKQCPYHFGAPSHICLTCRRSICLRCAITYCQQHTIHPEEQIIPLLLVDLHKLTIEPRIEDVELKLKQSRQKQEFMSKKISKVLGEIEENFEHVKLMLERKKEQIIQYYHQELANKLLSEFKTYDDELLEILLWLRRAHEDSSNFSSIEELDSLALAVHKNSAKLIGDSSKTLNSSQKIIKVSPSSEQIKAPKMTFGDEKVKIHQLWSEEKLEKVLYEIENINYRLRSRSSEKPYASKKKRVATEVSDHQKVSPFFSGVKNSGGMAKSNSNSRFNTGRKAQ